MKGEQYVCYNHFNLDYHYHFNIYFIDIFIITVLFAGRSKTKYDPWTLANFTHIKGYCYNVKSVYTTKLYEAIKDKVLPILFFLTKVLIVAQRFFNIN